MDAFLNQWWAGIAMAVALVVAGLALLLATRRIRRRYLRRPALGLAILIFVVGVLLCASSVLGLWHRAQFVRRYPAPGTRVDVGGYRLHVWAEGDPQPDRPTLVWLSGGYGSSLWLKHLHDRFKDDYRSILFDRAGSGWSDPGPMPRTQDRLAEELHRALDASGEKGPFVLIGHSAGGLQAAHFAHRFPAATAGVVVLDGSPPTLSAVEGRAYWGGRSTIQTLYVLATHFGLDVVLPNLHPMRAAGSGVPSIDKDTWEMMIEFESRPSALLAMQSLFGSDDKACYDMVRGRNVLGAIPVLSIVQADRTSDPKTITEARRYMNLNDDQLRVWKAFREVVKNEFTEMSSRGKKVEAPAHLTHSFPYEDPEFVAREVRTFLSEIAATSAP